MSLSFKYALLLVKRLTIILLISTGCWLLFSFRAKNVANDFLQELGISRENADQKISNSILGGYIDQYGLRNAKNIAAGNRGAVTKDLLNYVKQYVNSDAFKKDYAKMRLGQKPQTVVMQSPEEMRSGMIASYTKSISETEANMQKADASTKKIMEPVLVSMKEQLKEVQDPNNAMLANYKKNYDQMVKSNEDAYKQQIAQWETEYPDKQLLFVKQRLEQFLTETANIDFNAQLVEKNGRKYFANPAYERKSNRWKMAFRAGKEVVEPARGFVQEWIAAIN